ncbi:MAG: nucleoside-diphosphate kinase [Treponema sp.]|nr:nucleoside-diphosphate kinase [Treponema sp.]
MEKKLSYVLVTPHSMRKSRTGGVISRLLSQTDLELVGAQIIAPDEKFVSEYAASIRQQEASGLSTGQELLASYIENNLGPTNGKPHRSLLLVFRGIDPCRKLSEVCGALFHETQSSETFSGETIRDTYADLIMDRKDPEKVIYFEPAVLTPRHQKLADMNMAHFYENFKDCDNLVHNMTYLDMSKIEETLVILKPDNWQYASSKPGTIIDMFSRTGLRIIGTKVFNFSLNQALDFYGPVETALMEKLSPVFGKRARSILEREFNCTLSEKAADALTDSFGKEYAREEFYKIVAFMSGLRPDSCPKEMADEPGPVKCMVLVYEGENAVSKIRDVLGPTDPLKAPGGTVRREFGHDIMVNTAHASDSSESYEREKGIVKAKENTLFSIINEYLLNN